MKQELLRTLHGGEASGCVVVLHRSQPSECLVCLAHLAYESNMRVFRHSLLGTVARGSS